MGFCVFSNTIAYKGFLFISSFSGSFCALREGIPHFYRSCVRLIGSGSSFLDDIFASTGLQQVQQPSCKNRLSSRTKKFSSGQNSTCCLIKYYTTSIKSINWCTSILFHCRSCIPFNRKHFFLVEGQCAEIFVTLLGLSTHFTHKNSISIFQILFIPAVYYVQSHRRENPHCWWNYLDTTKKDGEIFVTTYLSFSCLLG